MLDGAGVAGHGGDAPRYVCGRGTQLYGTPPRPAGRTAGGAVSSTPGRGACGTVADW
jgi:hypothetical protein